MFIKGCTGSGPDISATGGLSFTLSEGAAAGRTVSGTVASFSDPGGYELDSDYSATINWGDGSPTEAGTISSGDYRANAIKVTSSPLIINGKVRLYVTGDSSVTSTGFIRSSGSMPAARA